MNIKSLFIGTLLFLFSHKIFAGSGSHGGGAVVCRDERGRIQSAALLDLWESEHLKGRTMWNLEDLSALMNELPKTPSEDGRFDNLFYQKALIAKVINKLRNVRQVALAEETEKIALKIREDVKAHYSFLPNGIRIAPPSDANAVYLPEQRGCELEGVGTYNDRQELFMVNREIFEHLPPIDQVALFIHEGIYKYLRKHFQVTDSIVARDITGCLFSQNNCTYLNPEPSLPETGYILSCTGQWDIGEQENPANTQSKRVNFFVYDSSSSTIVRVTRINDYLPPTYTFAEVPRSSEAKFYLELYKNEKVLAEKYRREQVFISYLLENLDKRWTRSSSFNGETDNGLPLYIESVRERKCAIIRAE